MTTQGKNLIKIWCVLIGIFLLGGVSGAAIKTMYMARSSGERVPSMGSDGYFEMLKQELDLDSNQASQMRTIVDEARVQYKSVCAEVRPRYDGLRESARSRMRLLLSPDQQKRFDTIVTREDCRCPDQKP
jgi:hypothetical protein